MVEMQIQRFDEVDYQMTEAINVLCTNLSFVGGNMKKIMITSCRPHEGKSFIAINTAVALAKIGMSVIMIDADIRASTMRKRYGVHVDMQDGERYWGLSGYLAGHCSEEKIIGHTNVKNLYMVLAGPLVNNAVPLLSQPRLSNLLEEIAQKFDIVLIDTPPIGAIIDAAQIANCCHGAIFVVESGKTMIDELKRAAAQIDKAGCPVVGYILNKYQNDLSTKHNSYYKANYGQYKRKHIS